MNKLFVAVNETMTEMNKILKKIFTYSLIISLICFLCASVLFVVSRTNWEYYNFCNKAIENFLQIFQYGFAAMIVSVFLEMFKNSKPM